MVLSKKRWADKGGKLRPPILTTKQILITAFVIILVVGGVFAAIALCSTEGPTANEKLESLGLLGEHELNPKSSASFLGVNGHLDIDGGGFIFFFVDGKGDLKTEKNYHFDWKSSNLGANFNFSVPGSKVERVIDETKTVPTIDFVFSSYWDDRIRPDDRQNPTRVILGSHEEYEGLKTVQKDNLVKVILRISSKDYENGIQLLNSSQ